MPATTTLKTPEEKQKRVTKIEAVSMEIRFQNCTCKSALPLDYYLCRKWNKDGLE